MKTRLALGRVHTSAKAQQSLLYSFINSSQSTMSGVLQMWGGNKSPFSQCYRKWEQIPGSLSGSKLEVHEIHSGSRLNLHPSSCSVVFVVILPTNQPTNPKTAGNTDDGSDHVNETLLEPEETSEGVARCSQRSCDKRFLVDMKLKIQTTQPSESPFTHNPRLTLFVVFWASWWERSGVGERSLTVSHLLLFVIFNLKKKKKSLVERSIRSIDTSLIFDTREFNVRHLYTGFSPAKQSSYFNHSERERVTARGLIFPQVISNEIHYHLQGWQRASLSKVQSEAGAGGESAGAIPQLLVI